jgi:rfaE bifunctional protein nucleotidyltransferase chain/domain
MTTHSLPARAGFIQFDVIQGAWQENLATVRSAFAELRPEPESLIVLPELWATGFAFDKLAELAEVTPTVLTAMGEEARRYGIMIAGSLLEHDAEGDSFHNTLYLIGTGGVVGSYRKQQLFAPMGEDQYLKPGDCPLPVQTELGLLAGLVCYDLRFPELALRQVGLGAKLIVVSAQWPEVRVDQWRTLLKARAIENQAFVVACNRSGSTGDIRFAGSSAVIGPDGRVLAEAGDGPQSALVALDPTLIDEVRGGFSPVAVAPYRSRDERKVVALADLQEELARLKGIGRRIVFTNGCFDILHPGHVTYLEAARRQGDCLVVGLNSDSSIRMIKGPERPVNNEASRARVLAALGAVDYITIFGEETPLNLITAIMPDILVKGADWPLAKIVGAAEVMARGGRVLMIPTVENFSTTRVIEAIRRLAS